jgi:N-acetylneuraminic acid mutarotase
MEAVPSPRWGQFSAVVEGKLRVFGGLTKDFVEEKSKLASSVFSFNPLQECWSENECSGVPPPGLTWGGCAAADHYLYVYGGRDGSQYHRSLHQLDTRSVEY